VNGGRLGIHFTLVHNYRTEYMYKINNPGSRSQHDQFQHFLFIPINPNIPTFMRSTNDIIHILNHLITLFFFLEVD
jgi:hypothetical protein